MQYVVVCQELHKAVGPIDGWDAAKAHARWLTERSDCTFLPVEFIEYEMPDAPETRHTGQYL